MSKIKKVLTILLVSLLVVGGITYYKLKSMGLIPRADYETVAPVLPAFDKPAILVLNKANGFIHVDGLPAADAMLTRIANNNGWDIYLTKNAAVHNEEDLKKFQVVVWNNVSGDVLTEEQRAALKNWIEQGGGWVGIHGAGGDPAYQWDWYVDTLIGAQFVGHTMHPQFQDADVLVADPQLSLTKHLPSRWQLSQEEWYAFDDNPRKKGYEIILSIDEDSYITKGSTFFGVDSMEGEHPLAWRHRLGRGRVFYNAIGHQAHTYEVPEYQQLMNNALIWAMDK